MPLAETSPSYRFGPDEFDALRTHLDDTERVTIIVPLDDPRQILLANDGRTTSGGDRFTWLAVRQACKAFGPGAWTSVSDLAGYRTTPAPEDAPYYSETDAIGI